MDPQNPVIRLCIESTRTEFAGRLDLTRALYRQAWETSRDEAVHSGKLSSA